MEIVKLKPSVKDYIWGGDKLSYWGKGIKGSSIAECWELSFNPSGPSYIASGDDAGKALMDVATKADLGSIPASFPFFPVLIKLIDSKSPLSIQVHPSDEYALKNEGQYGKTEMWHILEAEEGAWLFLGFKKKSNEEETRRAIEDGSITSLLNFVKVKKGENYFIPSGTVHAIGGGITLMEIQQNSTLTYRLYDYKRVGKDGKERELHVDKAMKVIDFNPYLRREFPSPIIGSCSYFTSSYHVFTNHETIEAKHTSFVSVTFLEGTGKASGIDYKKGDTFFIPASKKMDIVGSGEYVKTYLE